MSCYPINIRIAIIVAVMAFILHEIYNLDIENLSSEDQWGVKRDPKTKNILINCYVKPTARWTMIEDVNENMTFIRIQNPKVFGKGNRKLINFFARIFDVNKTQLSVIKGQRDAFKVVELREKNFSVPSVVRWIAQYIPPEGAIDPFNIKPRPDIFRRSN